MPANDESILDRINRLVEEEKVLFKSSDPGSRARLDALKVQLDQCWDLLRQREALREFGKDPDRASRSGQSMSLKIMNSKSRDWRIPANHNGRLSGADSPFARTAKKFGATPSQVALAWLLWRSPVMLPIPGTSRVDHLEENVAAAGLHIDAAAFENLQRSVSAS